MMNKITQEQMVKNGVIFITGQELGFSDGVIDASKETSNYIRSLLQGWRQGTVWSRGRSDVSFSNKKPWKQKGTGRARAGSPRSPLWRGGGVIFGPQERTRCLKINRKIRQISMLSLFASFVQQNKIMM